MKFGWTVQRLTQKNARRLRALFEETLHLTKDAVEEIAAHRGVHQDFRQDHPKVAKYVFDYRGSQCLLGGEVMENCRLRHPKGIGDGLKAGPVEPARREETGGAIEENVTCGEIGTYHLVSWTIPFG